MYLRSAGDRLHWETVLEAKVIPLTGHGVDDVGSGAERAFPW